MGCLKGTAKILLIVSNFAILVCAIVLITIGIVYKLNNAGLDIKSISTYTIVVGVIIALIALFGFYGACNGNSFLLSTYAGILIVIFIAQVVLGVLAFLAIKNGNLELEKEVIDYLLDIYNNKAQPEKMNIVNTLQKNFECCGIIGPIDPHAIVDGTILISSCCIDSITCTTSSSDLHEEGCGQQLKFFLEENVTIIGGIAVGFAVFELVAAALACCSRNNSNEKELELNKQSIMMKKREELSD